MIRQMVMWDSDELCLTLTHPEAGRWRIPIAVSFYIPNMFDYTCTTHTDVSHISSADMLHGVAGFIFQQDLLPRLMTLILNQVPLCLISQWTDLT